MTLPDAMVDDIEPDETHENDLLPGEPFPGAVVDGNEVIPTEKGDDELVWNPPLRMVRGHPIKKDGQDVAYHPDTVVEPDEDPQDDRIGDEVRVDLRPRERLPDGTERRLDIEDLDDFRDARTIHQLEKQGTELEGTLEVTGIEVDQSHPLQLSYPDHIDSRSPVRSPVAHTNPVRIIDEDDRYLGLHIGPEGFSIIQTEDGVPHLVQTDDIVFE